MKTLTFEEIKAVTGGSWDSCVGMFGLAGGGVGAIAAGGAAILTDGVGIGMAGTIVTFGGSLGAIAGDFFCS